MIVRTIEPRKVDEGSSLYKAFKNLPKRIDCPTKEKKLNLRKDLRRERSELLTLIKPEKQKLNITIENKKNLSAEEINQVAEITAECFKNDLFTLNTYKSKENFKKVMLFTTRYFLEMGEVHIAKDENGKMIGASLWLPPNTDGYNVRHLFKKRLAWEAIKTTVNINPRALWNAGKALSLPHPKELEDKPNYYLCTIASARKGTGSQLMEYAINKFGKDQYYYLENTNPANNDFYKKFGFCEIGRGKVNNSELTYMLREKA